MDKNLIKAQFAVMVATVMDGGMGMMATNGSALRDRSADVEVKECAYSKCDKKHYHNNSCCSAEHFKLYMKERKMEN